MRGGKKKRESGQGLRERGKRVSRRLEEEDEKEKHGNGKEGKKRDEERGVQIRGRMEKGER